MNWNNIKITIFKELRGIIRDKKSLQKLILYPLIIPIIIILFGFLFDVLSESKYVIGSNYELSAEEKTIVGELDNITIKKYNDIKELEKAYKEKEIDGYVVKEDNKYTIYSDTSQNSGEMILSIAGMYLESYNKVLGQNYLMENGIDSNKVFNNIIIDSKSLTKDKTNMMSKTITNLVITYIIMIVVMVCVVVVTDATSGEKERGTLETILTFPIKSSELVTGKYLATSILSFIVGLVSYFLAIITISFGKELFKSYEEVIFVTNVETVILSILVLFLTSLLSSGVCMALAGKSKSYKEAQSSLQFINILPIVPYFLSIAETNSFIFSLIPIANCTSLLNDVVIGGINYGSLMIIILTTIVYIILILLYISVQYKKEDTLFS